MDSSTRTSPVDDSSDRIVTITITPDGRVLLHDLPAALVSVVLQLNPHDKQLGERHAAAQRMRSHAP